MVKRKSARKPTPPGVETAVLAKSARRCALCFHLDGDLTEKAGQIAHLDGDPSNAAEDNLAFMCLLHHSLFDSSTSQHKNYTIPEVKAARAGLYNLVAEGKHLTPAAAVPYLQVEADKKVLRDFMQVLPSNGCIRWLRKYDFGSGSFELKRLDEIGTFLYEHDGPDLEFLDPELEAARQKFRESCRTFSLAIGTHTFRHHEQGRQVVPGEWEIHQPERFGKAVDEINAAADAVCGTYDDLVRLARRKLAV